MTKLNPLGEGRLFVDRQQLQQQGTLVCSSSVDQGARRKGGARGRRSRAILRSDL